MFPEILIHISSFLPDDQAVAICLRVSKHWYSTLLPIVWSTVRLSWSFRGGGQDFPPLYALKSNASLIYKLVIFTSNKKIEYPALGLEYPNLSEIVVKSRRKLEDEQYIATLIKRHQTTLRAITYMPFLPSSQILSFIAACPVLKRLKLGRLYFNTTNDWMEWQSCCLWSCLRAFSWKGHIGRSGPQPFGPSELITNTSSSSSFGAATSDIMELCTSVKINYIEELELYASEVGWNPSLVQSHLAVIAANFQLTRLKWITNQGSFKHLVFAFLAQAARATSTATTTTAPASFGRLLRDLHLSNAVFHNQDFKDLFQNLTSLTSLVLTGSNFDAISWQILKDTIPHCRTTFRKLDLGNSCRLSGAVVQDIMCTLSGLEAFHADYTTDEAILRDGSRPWVCTRLKILVLSFICFKSTSQPLILDRLSKLTELTELNLDLSWFRHSRQVADSMPVYEITVSCHCLTLSIEHGLDALRSLRRLERLTSPNPEKSIWGEDEIRRIVAQWRRLESLEGRKFVKLVRAKRGMGTGHLHLIGYRDGKLQYGW